ncbi:MULTISPECIES: hypothetical protein [unclassified Streptomyces]|uniref:hypothetical protein n=1 Tax=unclassified Streptomyces TaxID=2593676 RepID=UPI00381B2EBC
MEENEESLRVIVARMEVKLDGLIDVNKSRGEDHESRLRALERWKYALPVSAFGALLSAAVTIFTLYAGR